MKKSFLKISFLLILLLAIFLRFYQLTKAPMSLFGDEVDVGYQAWSILKTGRDYSGNSWPIHFQSLADWRTPLFLYATVPFVWLFGLTEIGVRFAPALFGVLTIPIFYFLIKEFFKNKRMALLASLCLAISPWHLQYSRAAFEATQMLFLIILGTVAFLKGLKNSRWLIISAFCLALAPYSYNTAKLFIPLFVVWLVFCFRRRIRKISPKRLVWPIFIFILISLPIAYDILLGEGGSRFSIISIFTDPTVIPQIGFERLADAGMKLEEGMADFRPSFSSRFFHNKFLSWGTMFLVNYFQAFSTKFLFTFGDINFRHSIQGGLGELYWLDALFLLLGACWLLTRTKDKHLRLFLFGWLLIAPIPSALTRDGGNHATRLILMLPPLLIFTSLGIYNFLNWFQKKKARIAAGCLLFTVYCLLFSLYFHRYYVHWPLESGRWWHVGFKEAVNYVKEHEKEYDYVVFSERGDPPLIFFLFWSGFDPKTFQQAKFRDQELSDAIQAKRLGETKYYFGSISKERIDSGWLAGTIKPNILYVAPEEEVGKDLRKIPLPANIKLLKIIDFPNGEPAKYVLTGL